LQGVLGQVPQKAQAAFLLCDLQYLKELRESSINPSVLQAVRRSLSYSEVDEIVAKCQFEAPSCVAVTDLSILLLAGCQRSRPRSTASSARSLSLPHGHPKQSLPLKHLVMSNAKTQAPEEETESLSQPSKRKRNGSRSQTSRSSGESRSQHVSDEVSPRFYSTLTDVILSLLTAGYSVRIEMITDALSRNSLDQLTLHISFPFL
jgi:hypothetical protein